MDLREIKGIGDKSYKILKEKGIVSIEDLIYTIPTGYTEYKLSGFSYTEMFNVKAEVIDDVKVQKIKIGTKISFDCIIDDAKYTCVAFNMNYLKNVLHIGSLIIVIGKYDHNYKQILVTKIVKEKDYKEGIQPEYNIEGISSPKFKEIVLEALKYYSPKMNIIPDEYFNKYGYKTGVELIKAIHSPLSKSDYLSAKSALKYYELLSFSIKMALIRENMKKVKKEPVMYDIDQVKAFIELGIKFELTKDQKKAVNNIFKVLKSDVPLNMLLEGDVGCGKTMVAIIASYAFYTASLESLIIAPTEALALQHYNTFKKYLEPFNVNIELLTSSVSKKNRNIILNNLKNGNIDILIGTHSVLNNEVVFDKLGFIVCDEQHKFGVEQRKKLREKGNNPDVLYMTATPIPRTLALTFFNDLDLETIQTMPSERKKTKTFIHTYKDYLRVLDFIKSEIDDSRQAYFVAPAINDSIDQEIKSVNRIKEDLETYYKGDVRIGLLHGKLDEIEKAKVLNDFMEKKLDILVSTTVIEVGIDNPNASSIVIIDANHFGLSTLHQLRGRVGRGEYEGFAFLMIEKNEYRDRLSILEETNDGFLISERDLKDRGPGDFLGTNQSGMLKFNFANIFIDKIEYKNARDDAKELIKIDEIKKYYSNNLFDDKFD